MTQLHATKRKPLEANSVEVLAALVEGEAMPVIAKRFGVHTSTVMRFAERHKTDLEAAQQKIAQRVEDIVLTTKEGRIRELAWLYDGMKTELTARGFMWLEPQGRDRDVLKMPTGAISEMRGVIDDIARELGERNTPKDGGGLEPGVIYRERIIEREMRLEPLG